MGEVDEEMITGVMKKFGISRTKDERCMSSLVDDGFVEPGLDNFRITRKGIERIEEAMKKGEKGI